MGIKEIKLRNYRISDSVKIEKLAKISFPKNRTYSKSYFEKCLKKYPETFIIAENKEKIIGYAIGQFKEDRGEIISLAIEPGFRRNGIGTTLSNFLINHFQKRGAKKISLRVRTENKIAIAFYKNLSFEVSKKIKKYYSNGDSAYLMEKNQI